MAENILFDENMPPLSSFQKSCLALAVGNSIAVAPLSAATITVDSSGVCTLVEAITSANDDDADGNGCVNGSGSDTIILPADIPSYSVSSGTYGEPSALPPIDSDISIQGAAEQTVIERSGAAGDFRIFSVKKNATLELNSVVVSGGAASQGAGIYVYQGDLVLDNTVISNNTASTMGGGIYAYSQSSVTVRNESMVALNNAATGAGINIYDAELIVEDSTFSQNTANTFGAISIQGLVSDVSLFNVTIEKNRATIGGGGGIGIVSQDLGAGNLSKLSIKESTFTSNTASAGVGGGAYIQYMATEISDTTFSNNYAKSGGGALYIKGTDSTLSLMSSSFIANKTDFNSGSGGAICLGGTEAQISDTNFDGNDADYGGGVFANDDSLVSFNLATIKNNSANTAGGGVRHASDGLLSFKNTAIDSNQSVNGDGGGVSAVAGALVVNTSTVSNNTANGVGGGIQHGGTDFSLYVSTISGNSADVEGAGLYLTGASGGVVNSTIYDNSNSSSLYATTAPFIVNTVIASAAAEVDSDDCVFGSGSVGAANNWFSDASCSGVANGNPQLAPLENDNSGLGSTTLTHATLESSPLLGAGLASFCNTSANPIFATDQRGVRRTACDIGAYEVAEETSCFVVKSNNGKVLTFCL